jgi:hypothetical protein
MATSMATTAPPAQIDDEADRASRRTYRLRPTRVLQILALATVVPLVLAGCSWQQFSMSSDRHGTGKSASTAAASSSALPTPLTVPAADVKDAKTTAKAAADAAAAKAAKAVYLAAQPKLVRGALAAGSTVHVLAAGSQNLVVNYWTTQNVGTWKADMSVPIQLSAHIENADLKHTILVSRFHATFADNASTNVPTVGSDTGSFAITPPFSYSGAMTIPAVSAKTTSATVSIEFDLLIETAPKSGVYFRQTVLDTLPLTYVAQS